MAHAAAVVAARVRSPAPALTPSGPAPWVQATSPPRLRSHCCSAAWRRPPRPGGRPTIPAHPNSNSAQSRAMDGYAAHSSVEHSRCVSVCVCVCAFERSHLHCGEQRAELRPGAGNCIRVCRTRLPLRSLPMAEAPAVKRNAHPNVLESMLPAVKRPLPYPRLSAQEVGGRRPGVRPNRRAGLLDALQVAVCAVGKSVELGPPVACGRQLVPLSGAAHGGAAEQCGGWAAPRLEVTPRYGIHQAAGGARRIVQYCGRAAMYCCVQWCVQAGRTPALKQQCRSALPRVELNRRSLITCGQAGQQPCAYMCMRPAPADRPRKKQT